MAKYVWRTGEGGGGAEEEEEAWREVLRGREPSSAVSESRFWGDRLKKLEGSAATPVEDESRV